MQTSQLSALRSSTSLTLCCGSALRRRPKLIRERVVTVAAPSSSKDVIEAISPGLQPESPMTLLQEFTKQEFKGMAQSYVASKESRDRLREAIMSAYSTFNTNSGITPSPDTIPDVLLGVMSSDVRLAVRALRDWCDSLGLEFVMPSPRVPGVQQLSAVRGSVYIKYNARTKACYVSQYLGRDRGVLLQLGQVQLGHFPLGLWDEEQRKPAPSL